MIREPRAAKVNLVLQVGDVRADGLHELCSLFASLELADELTVERAATARDEVICAGVEGPNLATRAIDAFRAALGGDLPPLRVTIDKRIPVAAGLGGGSADAAAVLRAANRSPARRSTRDAAARDRRALGADVPSQIEPAPRARHRRGRARRAGRAARRWRSCSSRRTKDSSTADVYGEADRIGSTRAAPRPRTPCGARGASARRLAAALENDLEPAALSLRPELARRSPAWTKRRRPRRARHRLGPHERSACSPTRVCRAGGGGTIVEDARHGLRSAMTAPAPTLAARL